MPTSVGPHPDAKYPLENVQTRTHGLIQDWIPPSLFRRYHIDLVIYSNEIPSSYKIHSRMTTQTIYNSNTRMNTLTKTLPFPKRELQTELSALSLSKSPDY